jgi:hypothetical protein
MRRNLYRQPQAYNTYLLILLLCSCTSVKFTNTLPGQPKGKYYTLSKEHGSFNSLLDTSVIYLFDGDMVVSTSKYKKIEDAKLYQFIILKSNGIAFYSYFSKEPITQTNVYTIAGDYCFYKVEGDELQIEVYDHKLRKFQILYLHIFPEKIHYYKDKLRITGGGTSKQDMRFIKSSIKYTLPLIWPE